jgi:heat shock protein HtpX
MRRPWRTWFILFFIVAALLITGYRLAERQGLLVALILAIALVAEVYVFTHTRFIETMNGRELEGRDPWNLLAQVRILAREFKIPAPRIYVMPYATATGFALGRAWQKGRIVLSEGALNQLDDSERNILVGFLMCQIRRRDTLGLSLGHAIGSVLLFPSMILYRTLTLILRRRSRPIVFFETLIAPIASLAVQFTVGRQIYLDCDREAAQILRSPEGLALTLWKLESWATSCPLPVPPSGAHMFVVNPLTGKNWNRYFHNQPAVAKRIHLLVGRYPI